MDVRPRHEQGRPPARGNDAPAALRSGRLVAGLLAALAGPPRAAAGEGPSTRRGAVATRPADPADADPAVARINQLRERKDVEGLTRAVQDSDPRTGARAVKALAEVGGASAREPVRAFLTDARLPVRQAAASAWGAVGDREDSATLDKLLADPTPEVRAAAATAAGRLAVMDSVPKLIGALDDDDRAVRVSAMGALDRILGVRLSASKFDSATRYDPEDPAPRRQKAMAGVRHFWEHRATQRTLRDFWNKHWNDSLP